MKRLVLKPPLQLSLGLRHDDTLITPARPKPGEPVTFSLWVHKDAGLKGAALRAAPDGEEELHALRKVEQRGTLSRWAVTITPRGTRYRYRFRIERAADVLHLSMRGIARFDPIDAFDFTLLIGDTAPDWPLRAILYQIFPDRFCEGDSRNRVRDGEWRVEGTPTQSRPFGARPLPWTKGKNGDFYGGDIPGIEQRLDYLTALGINGLYLNPIWPALTNHRYDVTDYHHVDPHLGGDAALASLTRAMAARDMNLVLDVVLNHSGSAHPWFNKEGLAGAGGAYRDRAAPSAAFYRFDQWPHDYKRWLGFAHLPRLNLAEPALRELLFTGPDSSLQRFLKPPFAVSGYRFDVAHMMGRDGDQQWHRQLFSEIRGALRNARGDAWLLGEHFFDPEKLLKGDGLDGVMAYHAFTFPLRAFLTRTDRMGSPSALDGRGFMEHLGEAWGRVGYSAWRQSSLHVNTHDIPRLQSQANGAALDVATTLQLALPGVPCLYYGDEVGMEGGADPDNRRCMEWDEAKWDKVRLSRTRDLVALRRGSAALGRGGIVDLGSEGDVIAFARVLDEEIRIVAASRANEESEIELDLRGLGRSQSMTIKLAPMSARIDDLCES